VVDADEVLRIGLCEYLTPTGGARQRDEELAQQIAPFPQSCLSRDRRSALAQNGLSEVNTLRQAWFVSRDAVLAEGIAGAVSFDRGSGRGGSFN